MSNLWLNPALLEKTRVPISGSCSHDRGPVGAGTYDSDHAPGCVPRPRPGADGQQACAPGGRPATMRRWYVFPLALLCLGGSAACGYIASNDESRAEFVRSARAFTDRLAQTMPPIGDVWTAKASALQEENTALRQRIARLEELIATEAVSQRAKPAHDACIVPPMGRG